MYSEIRSVQIVVDLLKQNSIKNIILSPGGSDIPLIHSIETDDYFKCYSVVDERSAAYFAMGVSQAINQPAVCVCTSGTAVCNYLPGITEAHYQNVPVLMLTADKNPYYQDQLETQKINQMCIFNDVVKKSVELPIIKDENDEWLCNRLVNEALLSLNHHGKGPVQINIPIVGRTNIYNCNVLPHERKIEYVNNTSEYSIYEKYQNILRSKKILVIVGQNIVFTKAEMKILDMFFRQYNCVFSIEHLSNLECEGCINTYPITEMQSVESLQYLKPDIVISVGNNLAAYNMKPLLRLNYKTIDNWLISEQGEVRDAYKCLKVIFECSINDFFKHVCSDNNEEEKEHDYYKLWKSAADAIVLPKFDFSNFYVAQRLANVIPENSILHLAILNSTRIMQFFKLHQNVRTYSNVGALGIDGCFSTFAGQAAVTDELAFLVIGDLSFFYDMNAAGLRSIGNNVRIILLNNGGGSEFQFFMGKRNISTIDEYICAEHNKIAAGWIYSLEYDYYSASTSDEFDKVIEKFGKTSDKPMFLEVFTQMEEDADKTNIMYDIYRNKNDNNSAKMKKYIKTFLPEKQMKKAKKIINILKEK